MVGTTEEGRYLKMQACRKQCCGSVTYWYGSESADPYHWLPDPRIRTIDLRIRIRNRLQIRILLFLAVAFCVLLITFWRYIYISLLRYKKVTKKPQNSTVGIKMFLTFLAWWTMKKGFGSGSRSGSVQIMADPGDPKTYGSYRSGSTTLVESSVADPWHFGVDPDPRIHASD